MEPSNLDRKVAMRASHSSRLLVKRAAKAILSSALILFTFAAASQKNAPVNAESIPKYHVTDLGAIAFELGNQLSRYICINNNGIVAGNYLPYPGVMHGFIYKNGHHVDLGSLHGFMSSRVLGINDKNQVVGYCEDPTSGPPRLQAFLWSDGKMRAVNTTPPDTNITAVSINNKGQVLLRSRTDGYLWDNGKTTDLHVEGAITLTDDGLILGTSAKYHVGGGVGYAYFCNKSQKPVDIGTLSGGWRSTAQGINDRGQVVGYAGVHFHSRAFL